MKLVVPVTSFDLKLLEPFTSVLEYWGGLEDFDILFVPSSAVILEVEPFVDRLRLIAKSANVFNVGYNEAGRWPDGPNRHWAHTVYKMDEAVPAGQAGDCWLWHELDMFAIQAGAYKSIVNKHLQGAKFFTGKVVATPHRDGAGNITYHPNGKEDVMMMGCAVYPSGMSKNAEFRAMAEGLVNGSAGIAGSPQMNGWDVELRYFFKKKGWTHTDLIGDRWNTINYRLEDGKLACDAGPTPFKNRSHNTTDITGAALLHGCKCDSLAKLILSGAFGNKVEAVQIQGWTPQAKQEASPAPLAETSTQTLRISALESKVDSIMEKLDALLSRADTSPPKPAQPEQVESPATDEEILSKVGEFVFDKRCMRLAELSKKIRVDAKRLEPMIEASEIFTLQKPLKWVKRKAA